MMGTSTARALALGALVLTLSLSGCKHGSESTTPVEQKRQPPAKSGTMSLQGAYSYMADAGIFEDCATQERWPVAQEGDNAALERAYGEARVAPGAPLLVTVEGRLEARPKIDAKGKQTSLIVERFVRTWPGDTCDSMNKATLENRRWVLVELNGDAITATTEGKAAYLELNSKKASAYGFGGCNRFFGSYEATDRSLGFSAMGATRMACPEGMKREQELFTVLESTTRYEIHGSKLLLFANDALVAQFEARPKPE